MLKDIKNKDKLNFQFYKEILTTSVLFFAILSNIHSQTIDSLIAKDTSFQVYEEYPSFPGGEKSLNEYLSKHLKYPNIERENGIQGTVVISFCVEADGSLSDIKILKSVATNIDNEAIELVKEMPPWNPGKQNGQAVKTYVNLPLIFKLEDRKLFKKNNQ